MMGLLSLALGTSLLAMPLLATVAVGSSAPDVVRAREDPWDRMTVPVRIGEQGPFRFLVDTGAQNTVLADTLAARLGLPLGDAQMVTSVAGVLPTRTVSLDGIQIGQRAFDNQAVPVLPAEGVDADGILGIDGLQGQRVVLDFDHNVLSITDAREHVSHVEGDEIVVVARRRTGQLIVAHARIDHIDTDVVIDTGAEISIGNRALQRALARRRPSRSIRLTSVTGQAIDADLATGGTLAIDRLSITNMLIAYADSPAFAALHLERRPALLLGMHELRSMRRVVIDFAHRKVLFDVSA